MVWANVDNCVSINLVWQWLATSPGLASLGHQLTAPTVVESTGAIRDDFATTPRLT